MMAYAQLFGRASKEVLFLLYAKPLRIHVFFLLFYVLCLGVIAGCAENDTANKTDYFNSGAMKVKRTAIARLLNK